MLRKLESKIGGGGIGRGFRAWFGAVVIAVLLSCAVLANDVTHVDVWMGKSAQAAQAHNTKRIALDKKNEDEFYVHVEGKAMYDEEFGNSFTVKVYDGGSQLDVNSNVPDQGSGNFETNFRITKSGDPSCFTTGRHWIRVKAVRNEFSDWVWDTDDEYIPCYVYMVELDILQVPEFLFANAVHATPIRFQVLGFGNTIANVSILGIGADLYLNNSLVKQDIGMGSRFTGGSSIRRENGDHSVYTGYINYLQYDDGAINTALGDAHWTDDAKFVVEVTCQDTEDDYDKRAQVTVESELNDPQGAVFAFGDKYLRAVQANPPTVGWGLRTEMIYIGDCLQEKVDWPPNSTREEHYQHWKRGDFGECEGCTADIPHEVADGGCTYLINNQQCGGFDHVVNVLERDLDGMTAITELGDDHDFLYCDPSWPHCWCGKPGGDQGVKVRRYLVRRGGFFYISYQGKQLWEGATGDSEPPVLNSGEYAMDLADSANEFSFTAFASGKYRFANDQDENAGVNVQAGPLLLGILSLFAGLPSVPWWVGTGVGVLGEATSLVDAFADLDDVDYDSGIDGRAQGVVRKKFYRNRPNGTWSQKDWTPYPECHEDTGGWTDWQSYTLTDDGTICDVGDQFIFFIELDSASSALSRPCSISDNSVYISQETEYRCTNEDDWWEATVEMDDS